MAEAKSCKALKIKQKFRAYLEKHRILEVFQELTSMLLIKKPEDHVLFLKQCLFHAVRRLDVPRIIVFVPPGFDKRQLVEILQDKLNIPVLCLNDIIDDPQLIPSADSDIVTGKLRMILIDYMKNDCDGWIFLNIPRTDQDARCFQRCGITPSHVIEIVSTVSKSPESKINKGNVDYYKEIQGLRYVYSYILKSIKAEKKEVTDIAEECLNVIKCKNYFQGGIKYRILLIDYENSQRSKCLGQYISRIFHIIHLDFYEVLEKLCLCDSELGDKVQEEKEKSNFKNLSTELKIKAFEHFAQKPEYFERGWVMTGFISTLNDFKNLDMTDNQPNRVLIIVPKNYEDSETKIFNSVRESDSVKSDCNCDKEQVTTIPPATLKEILDYAGESINVIKEHEDLKLMKEKIEVILMSPRPCVPPRIAREPLITKFEDIEFDPEDEPNVDIFDKIRAPEPQLELI